MPRPCSHADHHPGGLSSPAAAVTALPSLNQRLGEAQSAKASLDQEKGSWQARQTALLPPPTPLPERGRMVACSEHGCAQWQTDSRQVTVPHVTPTCFTFPCGEECNGSSLQPSSQLPHLLSLPRALPTTSRPPLGLQRVLLGEACCKSPLPWQGC